MGFFAIFKKASQSNCFFFQTIVPKSLYNVEKSIFMTFVKENWYFSHQMSIKMPFVKNCIIWVVAKTSTVGNFDVLQMCYIIYQYKVLYFEMDYQVKPSPW